MSYFKCHKCHKMALFDILWHMSYDIKCHYGYKKNCIDQTKWSKNARTNLNENVIPKIQEIKNSHFFLCILKEKWGFPATVVPVDWERNFSHIITICMQCNGGKQRANSKSNFWYFWTTLVQIETILKKKKCANEG